MLYLENLEPRCLLSIIITESDGDNNDILVSDPAIISEPPPESYIDITNDNDATITVNDIQILNQDETGPGVNFYTDTLPGFDIEAHETVRIPVYFEPQTVGNLEELLLVKTTDGDMPEFRVALSGMGLDVSISPPVNSDLTFFDTGIGQVQEGVVSIDYLDGTEGSTIVISDIQITGDCFSYEQPAPPETLPSTYYPGDYLGFYPGFSRIPDYTADEVVELEIGVPEIGTLGTETDASGTPIQDSNDIYSFRAQPGQIIEVDALLENYGDLTIQVYSAGGDLVAWDTEIDVGYGISVYANVVFPVPDNPDMDDTDEFLYYVEVIGYSAVDLDTYEIMVSTSDQTIPEIQITENPLVPSYEGVIGNSQFYDGEIQWLQFDADFGDQIDLRFDYINPYSPLEPLAITIFDKNGREITPDMPDDFFPFPDEPVHPDAEGIVYTLLSGGPFYLRVNTDDSLDYPGRYEYEVTLVELGSMLELEPGETLELPVYFRPDSLDTFSGDLQFNISADDVVLQTVYYTLQGESFPGDLSLVSVSVPNLTAYTYDQTGFPFVQSGKPLDLVATITNQQLRWGEGGDIPQSADLVYFLSSDDIYDNDDDIQLSPNLKINPLFSGNSDVVSGSVNIPSGLEGEYYLIAVVDPFNQVPEEPEPDPPQYLLVDPMVVAGEPLPVTERLIIAPENLLVTDSVDDPFDKLIDYGERPLNTLNTEYVWFFNRGNSPVTVTDYSLETGGVFQFPEPGSPDYQAPPIVIMPDQTGSIPVIFAPESFPISGEQILTDILTVQTSERALPYKFNLIAELAGANLIVLENSGQEENDNKMDLGAVRVDHSSTATFTLLNLGDQNLYINDIDFSSGNLTAFSYSIVGGGNLPLTLQPFGDLNNGNRAEILLTFTPNHTGNFTDTLIIHSSDTTGDYLVQLSGVGVSPTLVVEESQGLPNDNYLPFGWRPLNQPASTNIILSNAGTDALTLYGWKFQNAIPNDFDVNPKVNPEPAVTHDDIILLPGESQTLTITFLASAEGSFNDTLIIYSDDGQRQISLSSLAGQSALPSLGFIYEGYPYDALALDIGDVMLGQSASESFKIVNNGLVELTVDSISVEGTGFSLVGADLAQPITLIPSGKIPLLVKFNATPDLTIQNYQGSIIISSSAPQIILPVSAAIVTPEIDLSSTLLDFGAIDESQHKTLDLLISNSGNTDLIISDWSAQDPQFSIDVPPLNLSGNNLVIAPYQTITVAVTFDPQQYGNAETQLNLLSNDYDEPISTVILSAQNLGRPSQILPNTTYAFYDFNDDLVKVTLTEGRAVLYLNNGLLNHADIDTIMLYDTTPNTELKITVNGGQTSINSIQSDGSLGSINTPDVTINHGIDINGSLDELLLNNVRDAADIHVAQYSSKPMTVTVEKIGQQVTFDLASNVKTFQASSYAGGNLTALQIDLLKITNGSLGADVSLGYGSLKKLDVYNNITGNVQAFDSIGKATSKIGGIFGNLTAQTGGINNITAKKNITANIFAAKDVDKVISKQGTFAATLRAENVNKITARNINGAIVSTTDDIGKVRSKKDVRDSFFLAGYDIGMSLADTTDDSLSGGSVNKFKFNRELDNTFVAAGAMTDNIYIALGLPLPSVQPPNGAYGSINVSGNQVNTEAGAPEFGFFAVDDISTNLQQEDNFIIAPYL
jgi:hypothetical protein